MNFRGWIESDIRVTDRWPLNKATYDMDTPKGRMQYEIDLEELLDRVKKPSKMVVSERLVREPHTITCWRGFDMKSFKRDIVEEKEVYSSRATGLWRACYGSLIRSSRFTTSTLGSLQWVTLGVTDTF